MVNDNFCLRSRKFFMFVCIAPWNPRQISPAEQVSFWQAVLVTRTGRLTRRYVQGLSILHCNTPSVPPCTKGLKCRHCPRKSRNAGHHSTVEDHNNQILMSKFGRFFRVDTLKHHCDVMLGRSSLALPAHPILCAEKCLRVRWLHPRVLELTLRMLASLLDAVPSAPSTKSWCQLQPI